MGMELFTTSGTFNPASYGLKAGDVLNVICVGGGGAGGGGTESYSATPKDGQTSSFGSHVSSAGGKGGSPTKGGKGLYNGGNSGAGAGGYVIGVPNWGGDGQQRADSLPVGTAGAMPNYTDTPNSYHVSLGGFHAQSGPFFGGKAGSSISPAYGGGGGAGFGAGGGGMVYKHASSSSVVAFGGGGSGYVQYKNIVLSNNSSIAVTVGAGGPETFVSGYPNFYGGAGANGCVIVFW